METVVLFVDTGRHGKPEGGWKNKLYARTLRKIGFIDNRYLVNEDNEYPKNNEHWLVKIVRENQSKRGGCFILRPLKRIPNEELSPLVHGMYDMRRDEDAVIITPYDQTKYWVMSPAAKRAIQQAFGEETKAVVIDHGGGMWTRRKPPEDVVENEAQKFLRERHDFGG